MIERTWGQDFKQCVEVDTIFVLEAKNEGYSAVWQGMWSPSLYDEPHYFWQ